MDERKKNRFECKVSFKHLAIRSNVNVRRLSVSRGWTLLQNQLIIISI